MNYRAWSDAEVRTATSMRGKHTDREIAETLGRTRHSVQKMFKRLDAGAGVGRGKVARPHPQFAESADGATAEVTSQKSPRITTLEQLLDVAKVDRSVWDVDRHVVNKWEVGAKDDDGNVCVAPLIQVKAWLKRRHPLALTMAELRTALVQDIRAEVKRARPAAIPRRYVNGGWLFEFAPFDLHMGKYTWDEETVTNYDVDIAEDLFNASLDFLLARALKLSDGNLARVLCVFGNDVSHIDNMSGETTAGTRMDVDTRYIKVYRRICAIHRRAIDVLRGVAPVDVKIVPGNHDEVTSFHLGEILATRYETIRHVTIDNSPKKRKYYDFGVNLFGFTHGDAERVPELPLLMAREEPERWARCPSREWHIGHKHIAEKHSWREQDLFSDKGIRVRRLASLSAHDAWHTKHAYTDRRACEGFVFHREAGFTDHLSFNVDHFTGKVLKVAG